MSPSTSHPFVARGDLQEDIWLGLYSEDMGGGEGGGGEGGGEREGESQVCVINFKGKSSFSTQVRACLSNISWHESVSKLVVLRLKCCSVSKVCLVK